MRKTLLALIALGIGFPGAAHATGTCQGTMVPAYFYPAMTSPWDTMISTHNPGLVAVMNPASGPGIASDPVYVAKVAQAQAAGLLVIGYVDTNYTGVLRSVARAHIDKYNRWYHVNGIFLDRTASDVGTNNVKLNYYRSLLNHIKNARPGNSAFLNYGTYPAEAYVKNLKAGTGQVSHIVFEGQYSDYVGLTIPSWASNYNFSKFVHLVYNTAQADMQNAVTLSSARNVGYIYVTPDTLPNPYDTLSTNDAMTINYWSSLVTSTACN